LGHSLGYQSCSLPRKVHDNIVEVNARLRATPKHFHEAVEDGVK
jgi:hypothetical protein